MQHCAATYSQLPGDGASHHHLNASPRKLLKKNLFWNCVTTQQSCRIELKQLRLLHVHCDGLPQAVLNAFKLIFTPYSRELKPQKMHSQNVKIYDMLWKITCGGVKLILCFVKRKKKDYNMQKPQCDPWWSCFIESSTSPRPEDRSETDCLPTDCLCMNTSKQGECPNVWERTQIWSQWILEVTDLSHKHHSFFFFNYLDTSFIFNVSAAK